MLLPRIGEASYFHLCIMHLVVYIKFCIHKLYILSSRLLKFTRVQRDAEISLCLPPRSGLLPPLRIGTFALLRTNFWVHSEFPRHKIPKDISHPEYGPKLFRAVTGFNVLRILCCFSSQSLCLLLLDWNKALLISQNVYRNEMYWN